MRQMIHARASRSSILIPIFLLLAGAGTSSAADAIEGIVRLSNTPGATVWRIDAPEVDESSTNYRFITFAPGDKVSVFAGGCVQRGGKGLTWARYVDPVGEASDKLYHGLISIPGVTTGLIRFQKLGLDAWHTVGAAQSSTLTLGYEDTPTDYSDNGYYSHDSGLGHQCVGDQNAFVIIAIAHGRSKISPASSFQNMTPILSTTIVTERVSPRRYTTFAGDKTGLEIDDEDGVMCVERVS